MTIFRFILFILIALLFMVLITSSGIKAGMPKEFVWVAVIAFLSVWMGVGIILVELLEIKKELKEKIIK